MSTADEPDLAKASTLPASWYHDPAAYERERHAIFGREWLMIGPASAVSGRGDYVQAWIAGWNVFAIGDGEGGVRGFHNVCRHRAGPLVEEGSGTCANLVCRYHGWAYELDGRLRRARDFGEPADFDPDAFGLVPVQADVWRGLLFVNVDLDAPPLQETLGGFVAECAPFPMEDFVFSHEVAHEVEANWKTYADNYMEGYHIPLVHRGLNREVDAKRYRVEVRDGCCIHTAPARDGAITSGRWLWRFPNLALNLYPAGMNVERFEPLTPTTTRIVYTYFFRSLGPEARAANDEMIRLSVELLDEDRRICEAVQQNLESGVYDTGRLSPRHENGVFHLQQLVRRAVERVGVERT